MSLRNINIISCNKLVKPIDLINKYPLDDNIIKFIKKSRQEVENIINKKDKRFLCIIGPCSIHNIFEAKKYANELKTLSLKVENKLLIVMRVYFEKPRTTLGWKGLINDPYLDNSYEINQGLEKARQLLLYINKIGLPCACEFLDTITPQYISDLVSWGAIGARTSESQMHRQMVSGLSLPIGFKNNTNGNVQVAIDACVSSRNPNCFMGININGEASILQTKGNPNTHIILRGAKDKPNYFIKDIIHINKRMNNVLNTGILIDCSHGNSNKDYRNQPKVLEYIKKNYINNDTIKGIMIESNIKEGSQKLKSKEDIKEGISITDSCISLTTTNNIIMDLFNNYFL